MDLDSTMHAMVGIVSNDTVYNLDTTARTSTILLYVDLAVSGADQVAWSRKIDLNGGSQVTLPYGGAFS